MDSLGGGSRSKFARSIPPEHGRPSRGPPTGYYRRRRATHFNTVKYRQRSQVETDFNMFKRRLGSAVNADSPWSQRRALLLKVLTINIMILRRTITFQQSRSGVLVWIRLNIKDPRPL